MLQPAPGGDRLPAAGFVEADVDLPLDAPFGIPFGLAVAHQADARRPVCRDFHHFLSCAFAVDWQPWDFQLTLAIQKPGILST
jgi:hypothetical protein